MIYRCGTDVIDCEFDVRSLFGPALRNAEPPPPTTSLSPVGWSYRYIYWRLGGESFRDPNREIDFGFVFVHVSCVRAKLCAMIRLWLGSAKLFSPAPAAPPPAVGRRTSRDVPSIKTIKGNVKHTKKVAKNT